MSFESALALAGLLVTLAAFYFPYRASTRKERENRLRQAEEDRQKAIEVANKPLRDQLDLMTKDRDYFRDLVFKHNILLKKPDHEESEEGEK